MSRMQATCIERTVIVTLVMLIPVFVAAQGIDDRSLPGIEKLQPELLAKMETQTQFYAYGPGRPHQQTYRIIVSLQAQFEEQTMNDQSPEGMAQVQRHAEELQDAVLAARTQGFLRILYRYGSFYGFWLFAII